MLGIRVGAALQRDVLVELVRVGVVRDVQVESPVAVDVREHRAEAVRDLRPLDPGLSSDLAERRVPVRVGAFVQVEEIADRLVVGGEAGRGVDDEVRIGVGRDEEIRPPVTVDVADGGCRVPAVRVDARRTAPSVNVPSPLFQSSASQASVATLYPALVT